MSLSELILALEVLENEHGDVDVFVIDKVNGQLYIVDTDDVVFDGESAVEIQIG